MPISKPFHRAIRSHCPAPNSGYSGWAFIKDPQYAANAPGYLRAYLLLQRDFETLCQYVEPSPESLATFSFRIHELLMRICMEIEANFKAILSENTCSSKFMNMGVYRATDVTHHLSSYTLVLRTWHGPRRLLQPFKSWFGKGGFGTGRSPDWFDVYNDSKHDRQEKFKRANMGVVIDALAGLLAVITSQFRGEDFSAGPDLLSIGYGYHQDLEPATEMLFRIAIPDDWLDDER